MTADGTGNAPSNPAFPRWERLLSGEGGDVLDLQLGDQGDIVAVTRLGLFCSMDRGNRWVRIESPPLIQTLYRSGGWWLGSDFGLFRAGSLDGNWDAIISGVSVTGAAFDEQSGLLLVATLEEGLLRSEDHGQTWEDANPGLPGDEIIAARFSSAYGHDQTVFAATESGLFRSRNGGRAWRQMPFGSGDVQCFAVVGNRLMIGTAIDGLWVSDDAGRRWNQMVPGESITNIGSSSDGRTLLVGETDLLTADSSGSILRRAPAPSSAFCVLALDERTLIGTIGHGVFRRSEAEDSWTDSSVGLEAIARSRARSIGNQTYVTTSGAGAPIISEDGGSSWKELASTPLAFVRDFDARLDEGQNIAVIACDGLLAAVHQGSWRVLNEESAVAVAWLDGHSILLTDDAHLVSPSVRVPLLPSPTKLQGGALISIDGRPEVIWSVLYTENAGVVIVRSEDSGRRSEAILQTDAASAVSLIVYLDALGKEVALAAIGTSVYSVLESPEPVWTGGVGIAITGMARIADESLLLATSHGLISISRDFSSSDFIDGSPAPLVDVEADKSGSVVVIERGGAIWQYRQL